MAIARAQLVDVSLTRWYHCVTRCVRRAFLLGEGDHHRKQWSQNRLEKLAEIFAVSVGRFSIGSCATYTQSLRVTWSMATTTAGQQSFVANLNSLSWTFMKVSPTSWKIV
jgi:hypothetical protein